ncbi:MAG: ABC transporter substrate-binding protein [Sulfurospirillaceae bacterium]|nr:ABC transporter substrate-binding protein [Sulfurospirillaceae bacterium]
MVNKNFLLLLPVTIVIAFGLWFAAYQKPLSAKEPIVFGASLPLSGINSNLGQDIAVGANAYFSHINARGGINGRKIEFIQYDDKYEPENTYTNTLKLIQKDKVFGLFGFVGTPTVKRILPLVTNSDIPFIAPYTGAAFLRENNANNIINFRSSYQDEIEALVTFLTEKKGFTKFAIFYQNDDYGEEGYIALSEALAKRKLRLQAEGTYKRNTLSIRHAIHEIAAVKPEAIILVGSYKPTARFITKVKECCFDNITFCPISFVNANALIDELGGDGENILFSQTVPSYDEPDSEEAKSYLSLLAFYYPKEKPSLVSYESYLAAKAVVQALQHNGISVTRQTFIDNLKNLNKYTLNDIPLEYYHSQLLNQVYLSTYAHGKFHILEKYGH